METRRYWIDTLLKISSPVIENLANKTLRQNMPVEQKPNMHREDCTHLEAFGRTLCGIAPWLECVDGNESEQKDRAKLLSLTLKAIDNGTNPSSPDYLNFCSQGQPLVDAAFFAQGLLRAPKAIINNLEDRVKKNVIAALQSSRNCWVPANNWLLFAATVEAALCKLGVSWDHMRVDYAIRQHEQWYKGDGVYGDGPAFHWDYYNSFVIQPMLVDVTKTLSPHCDKWDAFIPRFMDRARRYGDVLERFIAPDGSFPAVGRSLCYRFGAFHHLAQMALIDNLPDGTAPAAVRCALTAVIKKVMSVPNTFDENGWLTTGFAGHQPSMGEPYISTGSLYLCSTVFLPLGLSPSHPFWSAPDEDWTSKKIWNGIDMPCNHSV